MPESHPHRAPVLPLATAAPRPLWSVMIPTYNCASYLRDTLASVLAQDPGPEQMQIEVVDDHSTSDDPASVAAAAGGGRVEFHRQPTNVGITRNLDTCLARSRGRLVHVLHGDDQVREGFYRRMAEAFEARPDVGAAFCRHIFMDARGHWRDLAPLEQTERGVLQGGVVHLASEQRIMTPAMVVRREVYEALGGFDDRLLCSEDWEMWVRIAARYRVWYETEPLAVYRMHDASNTGRHLRTAEDMRGTRLAIQIFRTYLPSEVAAAVTDRARTTYALAAVETAYRMLLRRDLPAAWAQAREAFRLSRSPIVIGRMVRLPFGAARRWLVARSPS